MRTFWLIPLLLIAAGCQSVSKLPTPVAAPIDPPTARIPLANPPRQPTQSDIREIVVVPPEKQADWTDAAKWTVELPESWPNGTKPTVVVVPVPVPAPPKTADPEPTTNPTSVATMNAEYLQRLKTIESAVQSLVTKVEQSESRPSPAETSNFSPEPQVVDAQDLPYQVGFIK